MKQNFDRKAKENDFNINDSLLKWDARFEDKGKHGKFDSLWKGPYKITTFVGNNSFFLKDSYDIPLGEGPVNGRFVKHYLK